jgi:nucleotide-binding universal stress UspA family protein
MPGKILYPVDFSPFTEKLLECADELARAGMSEVIVLHVIDAKHAAEYEAELDLAHPEKRKYVEEKMEAILELSRDRDFEVEIMIKTGDPVAEILDTARQKDVDLIFLGSHGKGFINRRILGSVSERVLKLADRPVMIQACRISKRKGGKGGYDCESPCDSLLGHLLVANDFSHYAQRVKPVLDRFATTFCTKVTLLHVQEGPDVYGAEVETKIRRDQAKSNMDELVQWGNNLGPYCREVETLAVQGEPVPCILQAAEDLGATMIILGALGKHSGDEGLLGGVTEKVLRRTERPVLVLKA